MTFNSLLMSSFAFQYLIFLFSVSQHVNKLDIILVSIQNIKNNSHSGSIYNVQSIFDRC